MSINIFGLTNCELKHCVCGRVIGIQFLIFQSPVDQAPLTLWSGLNNEFETLIHLLEYSSNHLKVTKWFLSSMVSITSLDITAFPSKRVKQKHNQLYKHLDFSGLFFLVILILHLSHLPPYLLLLTPSLLSLYNLDFCCLFSL